MRIAPVCLLSIVAGGAGAALADEPTPFDAVPVADAALAELRGGLEIPENLHAGLKLERLAFVNGEQVAHLSVEIPDIASMTTEQATALANAAGTLLIQGGANNVFNPVDLGPASTVIQNTLNDQHLVALTTISVQVNTLGALRELAFQDGVRDALGNVAGVR